MTTIRSLFDPNRQLDRRIEKVIQYDAMDGARLRQEVEEYVVTESMARSFEKLLDAIDIGMQEGSHEIGIWVPGFYGSGKSSFTKYLGFALDGDCQIDGTAFLDLLRSRFSDTALGARLATVARRHNPGVVMLDLASEQLGGGKVWLIATAQQTLTEDDPRAQLNTPKLFKLKDRFPLQVDLEASDIREICYRRLLGKSTEGETRLKALFEQHGQALRFNTQLQNTRYYQRELDRQVFVQLYPFLPQHFDILLELLGRLAKTIGGVGLRSAIKVIQDVLVGADAALTPLADQPLGTLATAVTFYDSLRRDIQRSAKHIAEGVDKAAATTVPMPVRCGWPGRWASCNCWRIFR